MSRPVEESSLDNMAWHSLHTRLRPYAQSDSSGLALRMHPDIGFFGGSEVLDDASWAAHAELVGEGGAAFFFRDVVLPPPRGWTEVFRERCCQFVAEDLPEASAIDTVMLGAHDVEEMIALVALTEPGPFLSRTHELGGYHGVRQKGKLVAMAGQRMQVPGFREISAVCTHPEVRRQGLGKALTLKVAEDIRNAGDEACLHVVSTNTNAIALYESTGFRMRREIEVAGFQRDPS